MGFPPRDFGQKPELLPSSGASYSPAPGWMLMEPRESRECERCGSRDVAEIDYGLVLPDVEAEYPDRRIILGGCVVEPTSPKWQCLSCGHSWGRASLDGSSTE